MSKATFIFFAIGFTVAIFAVDLFVPRGISVAALYIIPIILVQRMTSTLYTFVMAVVCGMLASVGIIVSPDIGVPSSVILADYVIVLMVIAATAMLGVVASRRSLHLQTVSKLLTVCAWTKKVKVRGNWIPLEEYLKNDLGLTITHGISEESAKKLLADISAAVEEEK